MAKVITIEGHENLGEMLQPERPATKESPDFCLVVTKWYRGWKPDWSLWEAYFNRGTAQAPQFLTSPSRDGRGGQKMDAIVMTGGVDAHDHTVALFNNCQNGYWYKCYEGDANKLSDIWQAAKGFYEYDRQALHDGKSPLEFPESQKAAEEYIPGYCQGCVRIEMDNMDYGKVFPAFKAVASDHCDGCTEGESFAECPNNCADWKTTPGEYCSCECHAGDNYDDLDYLEAVSNGEDE